MEEDNGQDEVNRQLQSQANTESNTQRGANTISRRSERIQRFADARQLRLQEKGSLEANYWALDQRHWAFLSAHVTAFNVHLPSSTIKEPTTYKLAGIRVAKRHTCALRTMGVRLEMERRSHRAI
jgi:hypothetical protein